MHLYSFIIRIFQMQLLVIQFKIQMFHIGFLQVFILLSLKSKFFKIFKGLKLSYLQQNVLNHCVATILMKSVCVVAVYTVCVLMLLSCWTGMH